MNKEIYLFSWKSTLNLSVASFDYSNFEGFFYKALTCILILAVGAVFVKISQRLIKKLIRPIKINDDNIFSEKRVNTLRAVAENIVRYGIYFLMASGIISQFTNISGILGACGAAAGVAIGLGAQDMTKNIIAGLFIIGEGRLSIGDNVELAGKTGKVETIGLRSITLRSGTGEVFVIPNGKIDIVANWEKTKYSSVISFYISYNADIDKILNALKHELETITPEEISGIVESPKVLGINDFTETNMQVSVSILSLTSEKSSVQREIRYRIKKCMEKEGFRPFIKFGGNE